MGSAAEAIDRMWRVELVTALRDHLPVEQMVAEHLAGLILRQGIPPGQDEAAVRAVVRYMPEATSPDWVERVMQIVQSVRERKRLAESESELSVPEREPRRIVQLETAVQPRVPEPSLDPDSFMTLVLERRLAVNQVQRLTPQVVGAQTNLRRLRIAVSAEADDSVRLPLLLAEWQEARRAWEAQNQLLQSAQATLRSTQWVLRYLQWPRTEDEIS